MTSRRTHVATLGLAAALLVAGLVTARSDTAPLAPPVVAMLTPIDTVPTKAQLDEVFGQQALAGLLPIALGAAGADVGVQLRAVHALIHYPGAQAHDTLVALVAGHQAATAGSDLLLLRAAIEALGVLQVATDLGTLTPFLEVEASRDLRATAALALRDLGNSAAIEPLRARYRRERTAQVRLAISEALRVLGQPLP
jgi:HEAT repeat protein